MQLSLFQTIKTLWSEIEQKNEIIEKISSEKEELMSTIHKKEEELKNKMDLINEKVSSRSKECFISISLKYLDFGFLCRTSS